MQKASVCGKLDSYNTARVCAGRDLKGDTTLWGGVGAGKLLDGGSSLNPENEEDRARWRG